MLIVTLCIDLTIPIPLKTTTTPKDKIQKENIGEALWSNHNEVLKCFAEIYHSTPSDIKFSVLYHHYQEYALAS